MSNGLATIGKSRRERESFEPFGIGQLKHLGGLEKSRAVFHQVIIFKYINVCNRGPVTLNSLFVFAYN